jgi:ribosome maturation factor RimP
MINAEKVRTGLGEELARRNLYLVDVQVRPVNRIVVFIDSMKGVTLDECATVSRFIESFLNREEEDFELEVSSPGLDNPLTQPWQFGKNVGRTLDVITYDGLKTSGKLTEILEGGIRLELERWEKDLKHKKRVRKLDTWERKFDEIKSAKIAIKLKNN